MRKLSADFVFALTNPGTEKALKLEVEISQKHWRLSYQRRGFVTFKCDLPVCLDALPTDIAYARRTCLSLGKSAKRDDALSLVSDLPIVHHAHFHEREMHGIQGEGSELLPEVGEVVGTVVQLSENEFWTGVHRHQSSLSPFPAGDCGLIMDTRSPSRAWLKLEEACRFFGLTFSSRDRVVELGCAPGGVVLALLDRGVPVIGVDPAKMAEVVMTHSISERTAAPATGPWFYHCRKPAALVSKKDLGSDVTWFMSDMNQSPDVVLTECARFCRMAPSIRGALITLKLTDTTQVVEKERWFKALQEMGFKTIRLQQLSVHHKELALLALR